MGTVELRDVIGSDLPILFEHQRDPEAAAMAAFPARDAEAFMAHWDKILADESATTTAVLLDGEVVGNVLAWQQGERRLIGYWIGREFWGLGIATRALELFVRDVEHPPVYAYVAAANGASIRVLEKCGFVPSCEDAERGMDDGVEEVLMVLTA